MPPTISKQLSLIKHLEQKIYGDSNMTEMHPETKNKQNLLGNLGYCVFEGDSEDCRECELIKTAQVEQMGCKEYLMMLAYYRIEELEYKLDQVKDAVR